MSSVSYETTPSSSEYQDIPCFQIANDLNFSNGFFKYLLESEDKLEAETAETKTCEPNNNFKFTQISHEVEFEVLTTKKRKIKEFICEIDNCGKVYKSKENLNLHIQNVHENQKPYKCTYCNMRFSHRNGRIYHERKMHTFIMPYKCQYSECGQFFPCKSAMIAHIKSVHLHIKRTKKK